MLLHDPYAMHRKWWQWDWKPGVGDTDWTEWDYILADVNQLIEDFTDKQSGQWLPYDTSGAVHWDIESKFSGAEEALQKWQDKHEAKPGETFYAVPVFDDPDNKPTLKSMMEESEAGEMDRRPAQAKGGRPPTAEELKRMAQG